MSNSSNESTAPDTPPGISDEQLPEDLRPAGDNPLAQNPDEREMERDRQDDARPAAARPDDRDEAGQPEGEPPPAAPPAPSS
jgi:hypothetical protein